MLYISFLYNISVYLCVLAQSDDGSIKKVDTLIKGPIQTKRLVYDENSIYAKSAKEKVIMQTTEVGGTLKSVIPEISDKKVLLHINKTKNETFSEFDTITLVFKVQRDLIIFKHFIEKQTRLQWQKFFEGFIPISPPYLDQIHFFIKKVNSRGKRQNRVLVFSNKVSNFYYYYHCS